jgi:hypothetical protein
MEGEFDQDDMNRLSSREKDNLFIPTEELPDPGVKST